LVIGDALWAVVAAGPSDQNALSISTISHYFSGAALMALDDDFARNRQALTTDCQDRSGARAHTRARVSSLEMNTQATKLQAVENDLKQLMADLSRAMEKAQEAVARIASKTATAPTETESTTSSCQG
jgi:hypothetical protein